MRENIVINAVTAKHGGQKTVLDHFIQHAKRHDEINFIIFVNSETEIINTGSDNIIIKPIKIQNFLSRIKWDLFGLNKWILKSNTKIKYALSLQNTGFYLKNADKGVLLHNVLPFANDKWSLFTKETRKLWILKNVYKKYQKFTIDKNTDIFVQNSYMLSITEDVFKTNNIRVIEHDFSGISIVNEHIYKNETENFSAYFYPADDYIYKNHKMIVDAIDVLNRIKDYHLNLKIIFTLDHDSWVAKYAKEKKVYEYFVFRGRMDYISVNNEYKNSILLFTSEIESLGLPIAEAMNHNTRIVTFALPFAVSLLQDYDNKYLIPFEKNNYQFNLNQLTSFFANNRKKKGSFSEFLAEKTNKV